jgi:MarR family transcriptional regulator, organic hydroperoxide resistance regulator
MAAVAYQPGDDFQSVFWETKHALALASMVAFSQHGVHEGQQYILRCLWDEDGLTPGEVAKRLGLATPTVTRATARMEATGLLRREPHPKDGRLVRLVLTNKGIGLRDVVGQEMDRLNERALGDFSPSARAALVRALKRVQRNLTETQTGG